MKLSYILSISAAAMIATASSAQAQTISVQFQGAGSALASSKQAGEVPEYNFNVVTGQSGTNLALVSNAGASTNTTLTFSVADSYSTGAGNSTPNNTLLSGKVSQPIGGTGFTLNDISGGFYNLFVYTVTDTTKGLGEYTVGGTTYEITAQQGPDFDGTFLRGTSTPASTTFDTANYVEYQHIFVAAGSSLTLTTANGSGFYSAPFSGFQLVEAPEPSSWALMLGGLALLGFSVRRRLA